MFVEDLAELPQEQLVEAVAAQAARVDAELCRLVELAAECERRVDWSGEGTTFAGWLAWRCSLLPRQAREHERIGKRLAELPRIRDAFSGGELSYAKVGTLTRVATAGNEGQLLELAEVQTASQLERSVGAYRQLSREEAAEQQEREFLNYHWTDDGSLAMRARLAADDGALVLRALDAGREALWERRRPAEPDGHEHARPSNSEALLAMAELALAECVHERGSGERYQVVLHVDAATLAHDADGRCELADGRPLAAETARRLSCDASLVELLGRDGEPLALGRKRRTISPALRRALAARDRRCRFPGCDNTRFVDGHHIEHWSKGGETNLDNLLILCRRHHRLVHERGYSVHIADDGEAQFVNQYGIAIPNAPPRPPPATRPLAIEIDADTCKHGHGDRMDLGLAVDAIAAIVA